MGDATPTVMSPTVLDLLCALLDTLDAPRSSEAVTVEEVGPSRRPGEPVEKYIIPPPIVGAGGDLVRAGSDLSTWGGPTLRWMATEGNPYFVLNDTEEREMWAEFRAMAQGLMAKSVAKSISIRSERDIWAVLQRYQAMLCCANE